MVDVLDERAENIVIEPPGDLGDGIEFILTRRGVREHHQVKRQTIRGTGWSIATLDASNILKHIPTKLGGTRDEFHFVSTMGAPDLDELSTNARQATDLASFRSSFLAATRRMSQWNDLTTRWQPHSEAECYDILQRTHIDTISEKVLRSQVLARVSALIDGPDRHAANELIILALDSINLTLTPDKVWGHLRVASLPRRTWANDPHALKALEDNNQRFLSSRRREFFRTLFPQVLAAEIGENLRAANATHALVTASAGGGKSGLLVQVIEALERDQIPYLAVRLDRLDPSLRTTSQIREKLDLPGSPAPLLAATAQGRRSVLILDQLDAVSLISGKNPDLFDPICDLLQEVTAFPEMRVVVACRAFDLDNDHRLKKLAVSPMFVRRPLGPLARPYILQGVAEAGFDPSSLSESQVEVLSNPLNLSMLAEIRPPFPGPVGVETSIELFTAFWKRKQMDVEQLGVTSSQFNEGIDGLCQLLEDRGSLFVPEALLSHPAAEKLASAHVFSCSDRNWGFFHESFYDFANARRLYRQGSSVAAYLKKRGEWIELRNQLRQSLAFRRAMDFRAYCEDLMALLADAEIRFHLKSATVAFLRGLADPSSAEWKVIEPIIEAARGSDLGKALFSLIGLTPTWFDLARNSGALSRWVGSSDPALLNPLAWVLVQVQRRDPEGVIPLLQQASAGGVEGRRFAAAVLNHSELAASRSTFDLYINLLGEGMFEPGGRRRGAPWMHLYSIAVKRPDWACEALGVLLRKAMQTASSRGIPDPFSAEVGILDDDQLDDQVIQRACQVAPVVFFRETWQSIVAIVAANLDTCAVGGPPYRDEIWRYRSSQFNHRIHDQLLSGVEAGIRAVASADFERFVAVAAEVATMHAVTIECLLVQGYASAAENHPDEALRFLLSDSSRFRVGWLDDPAGPARELIQNASPACSDGALASLERVLLDYYPDWERTAQGWRLGCSRFGSSQYSLLSSLPENRRSEKTKRRLQEWERKFGRLSGAPTRRYVGGAVRPPIRSAAADTMTDDQWLAAITKYSNSSLNILPDGTVNSGVLGLAQELQRVARNTPARFGKLMERIPKTANLAYLDAIIMAMADESIPAETSLAACRIGHQVEGKPLGQSISYCVGKIVLKGPSPEALGMVCAYIGPTFPEHIRSSAYSTLANLLIADRASVQLAMPSLELSAQHVPRELRSSFCYALTPLFGTPFQQRIRDLFQPMWSVDPWLPADPLVDQFLSFAFRLEYADFRQIAEVLLGDDRPEMRVMAARQATIAALVAPGAREIDTKLISGDQHIRKGLAEVCAANVRFARFREYCMQHLVALFSDADPAVRATASECFLNLTGDDLAGLLDLVAAFLGSPAADAHLNSLLDSLKQSTIRHDLVTLRACDVAVEQVTRRKDPAYLELQLCRDLVLRTYHQSANAEIRSRSLDLIDRLLGLEVDGLDAALGEIEARR